MANDRLDVVIFGASGFSEYTMTNVYNKNEHIMLHAFHNAIHTAELMVHVLRFIFPCSLLDV